VGSCHLTNTMGHMGRVPSDKVLKTRDCVGQCAWRSKLTIRAITAPMTQTNLNKVGAGDGHGTAKMLQKLGWSEIDASL